MDVLDAIEYLGVSTDIENINKLTDLLIDRERYGTVTIEEWSDVTEDHPDWEWNIRPKDIRQVIQHPNFERKGRQLPLTTEAHRRWRIAGVGLILIGSLIDVFLAGSSMDSVAMFVFLTLLLGWMTSSMLMEGGFFPVTGSV